MLCTMPLNFVEWQRARHCSAFVQAVYTDLYIPKRPRSGSHSDLSNLASIQKPSSMAKSSSQQSLPKSDSHPSLSSPEKMESHQNKIPKSPNPKQAGVQSQDGTV